VQYFSQSVDALRVQQESVKREREELKNMKATVDGSIERFKQRVKLNVGGRRFETTLSTLTRHGATLSPCLLPCSLAGMFEVPQDEDGCAFIDRDGTHFRAVLNCLRTVAS